MRLTCSLLVLAAIGGAAQAAGRLNLNPDRKFTQSDPAGAADPGFDDSSWTIVSLPHTFNDVDTFDDWSIPGHVGETNQWAGRTWYRKTFTLPISFRAKKVFIEFEAVGQVAEVFLNGRRLGVSKTGIHPLRLRSHTISLRRREKCPRRDGRQHLHPRDRHGQIILTDLPWNSPHWHPAHGGICSVHRLPITPPVMTSIAVNQRLHNWHEC